MVETLIERRGGSDVRGEKSRTVDLEIIDTAERLRAFEGEWQDFLGQSPPATPFQTPEWLLTWWSHFGSGKLHVLVFRDRGKTSGVLPTFLHEWNGWRQLTLVGAGVTDYLDPVVRPSHSSALPGLLADHLSEWPEWEVCDWQDLSSETPLVALGRTTPEVPCSRVPMARFDRILERLPAHLKKNLRRHDAKCAPLGELTFEVTAQADRTLLKALMDLHAARWRRQGEAGMIEANRSGGFLRDVCAALARRDMLRIFSLRLGERILAVILALRNATTVFDYLTAFDPEFRTYEVGLGLLHRALLYTHDEGYRWWDFLRGHESFKFAWGAERIPKCRLVLTRPAAEMQWGSGQLLGETENSRSAILEG